MSKNDFNQELWDKINSINLHRVWQSLIVRKGYTTERADEAINRYRKYLYLAAQYAEMSPTPDIDEVWHTHILFLPSYIRDCMTTFGRIIYHVPNQISEEEINMVLRQKTSMKDKVVALNEDPYCSDCEVEAECHGDKRTKEMHFSTFVPIDEYAENARFKLTFDNFLKMEKEVFV